MDEHTTPTTPTTMTMALHLFDACARPLGVRQLPVQLTDDGVVFTEATFPANVMVKGRLGFVPVAAFALHPKGHRDHQLYELPDVPAE